MTTQSTQMKEFLFRFFNNLSTKRFESHQAEDFLVSQMGRNGYDQAGGYGRFVREMNSLVAEGQIRPVKCLGKNGLNPPLYRRYQRVPAEGQVDTELREYLLKSYHLGLSLGHYLEHFNEYQRDKAYIDALDAFLKTCTDPAPAAVNERSFAIFGDEKFLANPAGRRLLQRLDIDYRRLNCYETFEPFFYYALRPLPKNDVLIVENKDTFFTLKKLFSAGRHRWGETDFRLLIYGEGKKLWSSLSYFPELANFYERENRLHYFGDLDPEGISIFEGVAERYPEYGLTPFQPFYIALVDVHAHRAPRFQTAQRVKPEETERFLSRFPKEVSIRMQELLTQGRYLPQEALDYAYFAAHLTGGTEPVIVSNEERPAQRTSSEEGSSPGHH